MQICRYAIIQCRKYIASSNILLFYCLYLDNMSYYGADVHYYLLISSKLLLRHLPILAVTRSKALNARKFMFAKDAIPPMLSIYMDVRFYLTHYFARTKATEDSAL